MSSIAEIFLALATILAITAHFYFTLTNKESENLTGLFTFSSKEEVKETPQKSYVKKSFNECEEEREFMNGKYYVKITSQNVYLTYDTQFEKLVAFISPNHLKYSYDLINGTCIYEVYPNKKTLISISPSGKVNVTIMLGQQHEELEGNSYAYKFAWYCKNLENKIEETIYKILNVTQCV